MDKPKIDWTKPIQNSKNMSMKVRVVGEDHKGNYVIEEDHFGTSYFSVVLKTTGRKVSDVNNSNFLLENIPEPKKEKWCNVFLAYGDHGLMRSFSFGPYWSLEDANMTSYINSLGLSGNHQYLGAFKVKE